jgi:hypothetical protein
MTSLIITQMQRALKVKKPQQFTPVILNATMLKDYQSTLCLEITFLS